MGLQFSTCLYNLLHYLEVLSDVAEAGCELLHHGEEATNSEELLELAGLVGCLGQFLIDCLHVRLLDLHR
jgi:hypothetical protein